MLRGLKRRRILLLLALAAVATAAGLLLFSPRGPKEPEYQGRRLIQWISEVARATNSNQLRSATDAVLAIGTNAIPYLLVDFTCQDSKWVSILKKVVSQQEIVRLHLRMDIDRQSTAAYGFAILGSNAACALPVLAQYLGEPTRGRLAAYAMEGIGVASIPHLLRTAAWTNTAAARDAAGVMATLAVRTEVAIPGLIQLVNHSDSGVRRAAVRGLAIGRQLELSIPALRQALTDPDPIIPRIAAQGLSRYGRDAHSALPTLLQLMTNSDPTLAKEASNAVFRIEPATMPPRGP